MDTDLNNPEVSITVNKERAAIEGVSTAQVGMAIRTALFGREVSKLKSGEDEYKIQLRYDQVKRKMIFKTLSICALLSAISIRVE